MNNNVINRSRGNIEDQEEKILAPYAVRSKNARRFTS